MNNRQVLLFHPRTFHKKNYRYYHVPYSLLALATNLTKGNFEVNIIDNNVYKLENYRKFLKKKISSDNKQILCVGVSCMIGAQIKDAINFSQSIRNWNSNIPIVWGGPLPTMLPKLTATNESVDIAVKGQGEEAFFKLVRCFQRDIPWSDIKSITFEKEGDIYSNPKENLKDLNSFPPYRDVFPLLDIENYIWPDEHVSKRTVSYHSSQGCPYNCGFCCDVPLWERQWTGLSSDRVFNDIKYLFKKFHVDGIKFYDSEFFIDLERALRFASNLIQENINIKWAASIHPKNLARIDENQLEIFAKSGLKRLLIGAESGVKEELNLINKNIDRDEVFHIAKRCESKDIIVCFTFVTGYPGMPEINVEKTLRFAEKLAKEFPIHEIKLHLYAPYPGTPLYPRSLKHGFKPPRNLREWSNFDYYETTTPWAKKEWVKKIRKFNEGHYPYIEAN